MSLTSFSVASPFAVRCDCYFHVGGDAEELGGGVGQSLSVVRAGDWEMFQCSTLHVAMSLDVSLTHFIPLCMACICVYIYMVT